MLHEEKLKYQRERTMLCRERNPAKYILAKAKMNAKQRGLDFNLELSDIVIPERCPYLDVPITFLFRQGRQPTNPSIDRIDASKGYIKGNIQIISDLANRMKQNATQEQLLTFAKGVLKIYDAPRTQYY